MKKTLLALLLSCLICLLLSACSLLKQDAASLYKKETPLEAVLELPASLKANAVTEITVTLLQNGEKVNNADYVHFEVWKQDGSTEKMMEEADKQGNGVYSIKKTLSSDGLYYVKVHASYHDSIIMPQKQFIVGELSEDDLNYLQKNLPQQEEDHEHHH
ncbi:FixH family protein [Niallia circulans]|uniref:FixH family protein n=1 Tax=Niallia circulans TaxID=1397 RepID=UPI001F252B72|nr:FixH family protein [Niallia circulans]